MLEFLVKFIFFRKLKTDLMLILFFKQSKLFVNFFTSENGFLKSEILLISLNLLSKKNSVSILSLDLSFNQNNNVDEYTVAKDILLV